MEADAKFSLTVGVSVLVSLTFLVTQSTSDSAGSASRAADSRERKVTYAKLKDYWCAGTAGAQDAGSLSAFERFSLDHESPD